MSRRLPDGGRHRVRRAPRGTDPPNWVGWVLLAVLTVTVLATWAPGLTDGLGDNHEGRILGRHALHVANAQEHGLAGSGWLADWSPYGGGPDGDQASYAHHPPLLNLGYYLTAQLLPVEIDVAVRVFAALTGIAALPLGAAVLRRLGFGWWPTLAATTAVAITPLFWVYGRLHGNVSLLLAMLLLVVRLREDRPIGRGELVLGAGLSFAAVVGGYLGLAAAALLGLWLLTSRGLDRVTWVVGSAMALGAAVTAAFVVGGTGAAGVADQVQLRTGGGGFTAGEFVERLARWFRELLPGWWRWVLAPAAIVAGIADRRSRTPLLLLGLVAVGYIVGLPNGSFVHDYWVFPVLLPVWLGTAALVEAAGELAPRWRGAVAAGALAVVATIGVVGVPGAETDTGQASAAGLARSSVAEAYLDGPRQAGTLVRDIGPADGQQRAWRTAGIPTPRWHAFYWQLAPLVLTDADDLARVGDDERVLVKLDRLGGWLADVGGDEGGGAEGGGEGGGDDGDGDGDDDRDGGGELSDAEVAAVAEAQRGNYAVLTGAQLRALAAS